MSLGIKEIQEILPHRYPFLLVDKIEEIEEGKKAVGYKNVTMNEYFFQGHFPEEPVMPGVLIVEALAQVGAVALLSKEEYKGRIAYFGGINKAKFRRKVVPGDVIKLEVEMIKMKGPAGVAKGIATVNGEKACEAEMMFAVGK
ncbi:3-hydroxyacyl-ACP dehydratase FabZ [Clostridium sp. ZS2-4]|uniref:3-hydroxyacyl-ACP dehydratase FabZ n=1 Tax=Clostridium sp. ZS2-4 TaxID=2987703 RepID=UPI00227D4740|nr:3-hydroxyacyl-ACP dehydratase FabZ [Clostridium sp. ZS2-4]MCY6353705.1 3-hydroxyacyl-ACP dehydratase FabZ [Clostridium sp. ZS2-4]